MEILNAQELKRLASVIDEVENKTSGEIRLMIVERSAVTGHVGPLLWAVLVSFAVMMIWFWHLELEAYERWWMWPLLMLGLLGVAGWLARFPAIQRRFTSYHDLHHQVWARAEVEFHREGLSHTELRTGVLLFVSLMERQAVVLADKGIAAKVPANTWDGLLKIIVEGASTGRWAEKLDQAVRECGKYLAEHFPPQGPRRNELPNDVILK